MKTKHIARTTVIIDLEGLDQLFEALKAQGYRLIGPAIRDQAIVYDEIDSVKDLPVGWTDRQAPGSYRLTKSDDGTLFGYVVGPQSWKKYLMPPQQRLVQISRNGQGIDVQTGDVDSTKRALIGVRPCELAAIAVQDAVFLGGAFVEPRYQMIRDNLFLLAVNCTSPASTCFCTSLGTGPQAENGFDLALTECVDGGSHEFTVDIGSELGASLLESVRRRAANDSDLTRRASILDGARRRITQRLETQELKELLYRNYESSHWDRVADRCLSCGNCTMVCPTCFCSTVEDYTDLSGVVAERHRKWDSCFTMDFSYIVGGSTRVSTAARYRHWMTHKLATWQDQFGMIGCVGCGRCITWCPVGIDITEEATMLHDNEMAQRHVNKEHSYDRREP